MSIANSDDRIVDWLAAAVPAGRLATFGPSEASRRRAWDLVEREKAGSATPEEAAELDRFQTLEPLRRLAKARAGAEGDA